MNLNLSIIHGRGSPGVRGVDEPHNSFIEGALDKYNIIPNFFFSKKAEILYHQIVGVGNDCMLSFTF